MFRPTKAWTQGGGEEDRGFCSWVEERLEELTAAGGASAASAPLFCPADEEEPFLASAGLAASCGLPLGSLFVFLVFSSSSSFCSRSCSSFQAWNINKPSNSRRKAGAASANGGEQVLTLREPSRITGSSSSN